MWILALGCVPPSSGEGPRVVAWSRQRAPLVGASSAGRAWKRGIIHLHSPYSHDACDGHEGELTDEQCGQDLRDGLCADAEDFAFLTDHPAMAAEHTYEELLRLEGEDEVVDGVANAMACPDGRRVLLMPGIEDELMPIGLDAQAATTAEENDEIYNGTEQPTFDAEIAAGAAVFQAHTEGKTIEDLLARQQMGLAGVEVFNLHAMVDPTKREEDLGLDATSYLADIGPFIAGTTDAEPDLAFLAFFQEQTVSLERLDALNQVAFTAATAGTDAHENAIPSLLSDDERVDSYRRMMSWFSNVLLVDDDSPAAHQDAAVAGHGFVAFEALGTPAGFDVRYGELDMGGEGAVGGTLSITCPTLAETTPQDGNAPDIDAVVYKDGAIWQEGCGDWPVDEAGAYRVTVEITPNHLAGFLDDQAEALIHPFPWIYSNAFRLGL
jgi:hypothetical protein